MAGSVAYEMREFRRALGYWQRLLGQLTPGTPEHAQLAAAVARTERLAKTSLQ
jgi:cytochrome c-type biogenesis protein CcmH/NrfG